MPTFDLIAFPANASDLHAHPLPLNGAGTGCRVELRNLPGATHLHVLVQTGDTVLFRAEIPGDGGEILSLVIRQDEAGKLLVECPGRPMALLPNNPALQPPVHPIVPTRHHGNLDMVIVIDATVRVFEPGKKSWPLLADQDRWAAHVAKLRGFMDALMGHFQECRCAVLAFGDQPIPNVTAADLQPAYRLFPTDIHPGLLRVSSPEQIERQLLLNKPSSGGDFVDALADALAACQSFHWRPAARKLLLLSGDSPGHSIVRPVPKGGDACVRQQDVETDASRLHRLGVEILTLYHEPDHQFLNDLIGPPREFQQYAQDQYLRLASLPEFAFVASHFDGKREAEQACSLSGLIGHGGSYGEWLTSACLPSG